MASNTFPLWAISLAPSLAMLSSFLDFWDRTALCSHGWPQSHYSFQVHFKLSILWSQPHWYCVRLNYFLSILVPLALPDLIPSTVVKANYATMNKALARCLNHTELGIVMVTVTVPTGGDGTMLGWCFSQVRPKGDLIKCCDLKTKTNNKNPKQLGLEKWRSA